tara:strand:+ start:534 stop:1298 length:765 start_codon:yes stop_codon:yes gene_type:complete
MQQFFAETNRKPANIVVGLRCSSPTKIRIRAIDPYKHGAVYMDRVADISGDKNFEIRLPQSPEKLLIKVMAVNGGQVEVVNLEKKKLLQYLPCLSGKKVSTFLKFAKQFCENAGILAAGRYQSDNRKYTIDYLPQIVHSNGQVLSTPARISNSNGRMEISQKAFRKMSIPMRMAIICHEFSHFYLNEVQKDEIEADLNALTLYMGMGYPVIEAHKAFLETFYKAPSEMNKERYVYLKTFIDNFDTLKHKICVIP